MKKIVSRILILYTFVIGILTATQAYAEEKNVDIYFFGRDDCHFCQNEEAFFDATFIGQEGVTITYINIVASSTGRELFNTLTEVYELPKVTPLTLVGGKVIQGYNSDDTTGARILESVAFAQDGHNPALASYVENSEILETSEGCDTTDVCGITAGTDDFVVNVPFFGVVSPEKYSLFALSGILGLIDGFNPCAMWVLITFLLILMQVGDRKKMAYTVGLFLAAEAIMYYLILTVWYTTWDFVGLDRIVTPLIGLLAVGSGGFFIYRWYTQRNKPLTCDITSLEHQNKVEKKIRALIEAPLTLGIALGIIGVAFSVNVIEFACSIGIPQVFTKILEINAPSFFVQQWYTCIYIVGFMADDIVVFSLALYGINKLHTSAKYSKIATLIGGVLMLVLGVLLIAFPDILVF